jgi:hypothetical protein
MPRRNIALSILRWRPAFKADRARKSPERFADAVQGTGSSAKKMTSFFPFLRLSAIAALSVFLVACSRRVNVSVFVVTKGGDNVKLGLVKVWAIPLDEAAAKLRPLLAGRAKAQAKADEAYRESSAKYGSLCDRLFRELDAARARVPVEDAEATKALMTFNQVVKEAAHAAGDYEDMVREKTKMQSSDPRYTEFARNLGRYPLEFTAGDSPVWSEEGETDFRESTLQDHSYKKRAAKALEIVDGEAWAGLPGERIKVSEAAQSLKAASEKAEQAHADTRRIEKEYDEARDTLYSSLKGPDESADEFLDVLPDRGPSATTDADGRCALVLPSGKWLLAAHAGRQLPDGSLEDYAWIVDATKSERLTLSNNNLLLPGGGDLKHTLQEASR